MNPLAKIRALHLDRDYLQLHGDAFSPAKCLLILDLSRCSAQKLPDSIGQLKQLRYLDVSWDFGLETMPILIPKALGSLNKLQYLNLSRRGRLIGLPEVINKLMELRYLNISHYQGYYSLDRRSANQSFIDCIGTLPNLEQLDLSSNDYVFSVPESFSSLKKLNLYGCNHISSLPENLAKVDIRRLFGLLEYPPGEWLPCGKDFHLRAVDSESCSSLVWLKHTNPDVLHITDLQNVKSIEEARSIRLIEKNRIDVLSLKWARFSRRGAYVEPMELLTELVPPSSVKKFKLRYYHDFILPDWFMSISKYLPNLVSLVLWDLPCMILPTLVQLPNLRKIDLSTMFNLEEFNTTCSMGEHGANELALAKLEYLEIRDCPNLRIRPCPPRAAYCCISESDNVLSWWGECASSTPASSSSSPVSKLAVQWSRLPLHQWRLLHHLSGLSDLSISYCYNLTISPQITQAFTSLESLSLTDSIYHNTLPEWLGKLTSLRQLHLKMNYLEELHENMRPLTQLESLSLGDCYRLTTLPQWLGELTCLKTLQICSCKGIICLPESILTNLQELHISDCFELSKWCMLEEN